MKNIAKKCLVAVLALTTTLSTVAITGCGSLEMTSVVVDQTTVDRTYAVNEDVDAGFANIKITAKFNDGSTETVALSSCKVFMGDEEITGNLDKIAQSKGEKTIKIEYQGKSATFKVTVTADGSAGGTVVEWAEPANYRAVKAAIAAAGTDAYGEEDYETQFMKKDTSYLAGDDNEFKFKPLLRYRAEGQFVTPSAYATETEAYIKAGDAYVKLDAANGTEPNTVDYSNAGTVYLTANVTKNTYDFKDAAVGNAFKLSVLPTSNYELEADDKPIACEVSVVDGFNVYTAKQLSVLDNNTVEENGEARNHWTDIKQSEGLLNIDPNAIILQDNITITKDDIPSNFWYELNTADTWYTQDDWQSKQNPLPGHKVYMKELIETADGNAYTEIYSRRLDAGETFEFHGNYFTLDMAQLPLVRSIQSQAHSYYASGDFTSNVSLIRVQGYTPGYPNVANDGGIYGDFKMSNLSVNGNANIEDRVNGVDGSSVGAGGTTFIKFRQTNATVDNIIERTSIFGLYPEENGTKLTVKNSKIYDNYQNALYSWNGVDVSIQNCNFERAGGPLIMSQMGDVDTLAAENASKIVVDDASILVNYVYGDEFWFMATGANTAMADIKALDGVFAGFAAATETPRRSILKEVDGLQKMNYIALIMPSGGPEAMTNCKAQGYFSYKDGVVQRTPGTTIGDKVFGYFALAGAAPCWNTQNGFGYMLDPQTPCFQGGFANATMGQYAEEYLASNYIALNIGGLGMLYQLH